MPDVEPRPDPYGKYADSSALADYLEVLALSGVSATRSDLADQIADNSWTIRVEELFAAPGESARDKLADEEGVVRADRVFRLLEERARELGSLYPFQIDTDQILVAEPLTEEHERYIGLLAITLAHAYGLHGDVTAIFEELVASALRDRGMPSVRIGSAGSTFEERVRIAGEAVQLSPTPEAEIRKKFAYDEKGDVLSHFGWPDRRVDTWTAVGQATCAQSEDWESKIAETSDVHWRGYLGVHPAPIAFLAIPHHAEPWHRHYLTGRSQRLLLDRLRLVAVRRTAVDGEAAIIASVRDAHWFSPYG